MKKLTIVSCVLALLAVWSCGQKHTRAQRLLENYAQVTIPAPDLSGITDNGKEVLNLYRFAADEADAIYWEQVYGAKADFEDWASDAEKEYALINYGPWDRIDGKAFIEGFGTRPAGACFYPSDITKEEFDALDNPDKNSPYTLIRRGPDGQLEVEWYHQAYAGHVGKIANYLKAASDITIKTSVRDYLVKKADALQSDNYYESEKAWLELSDSKMDLIIGPNEAIDDQLFGLKASYGAYVLLKNQERTDVLQGLCARLPEYQAALPGDPRFHDFVPGAESNIYACDAIYYGGYTNAGYKVIAVNFPYDATLQQELGTRTVLFDNIIREKYNYTVFPLGRVLFEDADASHIDANAFYFNIVFRELAKGLGVKETINGNGPVATALGAEALTLEKAKSNVLGVWLNAREVERHQVEALIQRDDVLATFVASVIRSCRFGAQDATGKANLIIYNTLLEEGAIFRQASGRYKLDYDKTLSAITALGARILEIQATGNSAAAASLVEKYAVVTPPLQADIVALELEKIPVDIRLTFEK